MITKLKNIKFNISEVLELYKKTGENDILIKECIEEISSFISDEKNHMEFILKGKRSILIRNLIKDIRDKSIEALGILEKIEARKILNEERSSFEYGEKLASIVKLEIEDFEILKSSKILFIGAGAMPITAYTIFKEASANIICVDTDSEAIDLAKQVSKKLGIDGVYFERNIENIEIEKFTHIIIASLVQKKDELLEYISPKMNKDTKIILRYGNEIKEIFNFPFCAKQIKNFNKTIIRDKEFIYDILLLERT